MLPKIRILTRHPPVKRSADLVVKPLHHLVRSTSLKTPQPLVEAAEKSRCITSRQ
jgi:hypothetical protein